MRDQERLLRIASRFEEFYGPIPWESHGDPLDILILTILSQNTNDINRDRAYESLCEKFPSYEAIVKADVEKLAEAIQVGGLHRQKARRIQQVLRVIKAEHGKFSLDHLKTLSREEALQDLLKHDGVGKKTAGIVLTFSLKKPYFPVDTHIQRITRRLRLVKGNQDPHDVMNELVPDHLKYQLHLHLIHHGRETCKARKPLCEQCVINDLCPVPEKGLPKDD
jgi:endonuclease-3